MSTPVTSFEQAWLTLSPTGTSYENRSVIIDETVKDAKGAEQVQVS